MFGDCRAFVRKGRLACALEAAHAGCVQTNGIEANASAAYSNLEQPTQTAQQGPNVEDAELDQRAIKSVANGYGAGKQLRGDVCAAKSSLHKQHGQARLLLMNKGFSLLRVGTR